MDGSQLEAYLPLVLLVFVGYLLLVRPARKRARATSQLQSALSPGDEVMLTSGIFATILDIQDEIARVELAPGVVVRVHRGAVGQLVHDLPPADPATGGNDQAWGGEPRADDNPGDDTTGVN